MVLGVVAAPGCGRIGASDAPAIGNCSGDHDGDGVPAANPAAILSGLSERIPSMSFVASCRLLSDSVIIESWSISNPYVSHIIS